MSVAVGTVPTPPSEAAAPAASGPVGPRSFGLALAPIVAVGLAVRVAYAVGWRFGTGLRYDGPVYLARARFLLQGRGFTNPDEWYFHDKVTEGAIHPPGNTVILALGRQLGLESIHALQIWGCLLGAATLVVLALLGREVAGPRVGLLAAAIGALHPGLWSYDPTVMAETPGQFFTALTLLLAYRFWRAPSASRAAWLGASAAAGALTRSELAILIPVLVLPITLVSHGTARQAWARVGAAMLWVAMLLGPWVGWNLVRFEHPVTIASGLDISLAYAQCDDTWYGPNTGYWNVFCGAEIPQQPENRNADESEISRLYRIRAGQYIADHRSRWPVVIAARAGRTLSVYRPFQQIQLEHERESRETPVLWAATLATWATYGLALVAFRWPPRSRRHLLPLLAPLIAGTAGAAVTFGTTRYRSAGEIGLVVLAAVGIDAILARRATRSAGTDTPEPPPVTETFAPIGAPPPTTT